MKNISCLLAGAITLLALSVAEAQTPDTPSSAAPTASRAAREAAFLAVVPSEFYMDGPFGAPRNEKSIEAEVTREVTRIARFNPGKEAAIHTIVTRRLACDANTARAVRGHALQAIAHALPDDALDRLTAFFSSQDSKRFIAILSEDNPTQAEQAEANAITSRYGGLLEAYVAESYKAMDAAVENPEFIDMVKACRNEQAAAFAQANIRDRK